MLATDKTRQDKRERERERKKIKEKERKKRKTATSTVGVNNLRLLSVDVCPTQNFFTTLRTTEVKPQHGA
jgi:hypothetical protein